MPKWIYVVRYRKGLKWKQREFVNQKDSGEYFARLKRNEPGVKAVHCRCRRETLWDRIKDLFKAKFSLRRNVKNRGNP